MEDKQHRTVKYKKVSVLRTKIMDGQKIVEKMTVLFIYLLQVLFMYSESGT